MKWYQGLALVVSVALAGCAAPGGGADGASDGASAATSTARTAPRMPRSGEMPDVAVSELRGGQVAALEAPADLWERVRRGFAMPDLQGELVERHEQWYTTRPDYIERMVDRSRLYIFHIVEELELRGMPTELALLPYIESAFNPQAVSSAKAAGMWQFMPATGSSFDLRQNMLRDDRRDVIASTRAALDYLQKLHDRFGDWHLALAAYNWGQGNVNRAIERNKAAGLGTSYLDLNMPAETRNYVPKLQAVKNIVAQPELFGITLPPIPNRPYFVTVESRVPLDLATAARLAETPVDEILALNPGYKRPILPTAGPQSLVVPAEKLEAFLINLQRHDPANASWKTYELQEGEGLEGVADRLGISASRLRQVNGLSPRARIGTGYTLIVPSESEGDRISLASLMPNRPQAGAVEPPPPPRTLVQRTTVRGKNGRPVVIERKIAVPADPAPAAGRQKGARPEKAPPAPAKAAGARKAEAPKPAAAKPSAPAAPAKKRR